MYTAINIDVFIAAYSGALGGFVNQQRTILRDSAEYQRLVQQALAFAEEFDTLYASVMPNVLQLANIESATSEYFNGYNPPGGLPSVTASHYVESAQNIINLLTAADTNVAGNVTNPIPFPPSGGGGTLAGDVVGPALTNKVEAISGNAGTVIVHANEFFWDATSVPLLAQTAQSSNLPTHDFVWAPQAPFGGATGTNRTPGNAVVQIAAPAAGGDNAYFRVNVAGNDNVILGAYPGAPTLGAMWMGQVTPTILNFIIAANASNTSINSGTGGIFFGINNGNTLTIFADRVDLFHGQTGLIQIAPQSGDTPTFDLQIAGQAPTAGSTGANRNPGNIIFVVPAQAAGGAPGYVRTKIGADFEQAVGSYPGFPQYGVIWLGQVAPGGAGNYAILSDGSDCFVNGVNSARFAINGAPKVVVIAGSTSFFTDIVAALAGLDINGFRNIGGLTNSMFFSALATSPIIYQATALSDVATFQLELASQGAFAGASGTNRNSGALRIGSGAPAAGGVAGDVNVFLGTLQAARFRSIASVGSGVLTVFDGTLAQDCIIAVHQDDDSPYSMRFYNDTFGATTPVMSYYPTGGGFWRFVLETANKSISFDTGGFGLTRMQIRDTDVLTSVGVGIGHAFSAIPAVGQLFVNTIATPADAQIKLQANLLSAMTLMCFAPDNQFLTFDVEYTSGSFIARDVSAAMVYKNNAKLHLYGNSGLTPNVGFSPIDRWSLDLATGNVTMNGPQMFWSAAVVTPILYVADQTTNGVDGTSLTVSAQNSTGTGTRGGSLFLKAGTGTSIQGQIFMYGSLNLSGTDGNPRIFISGATISFEAGQTPFFIQEDLTTASGTGHLMTIRAQNETGTTSTGGTLLLASGTGTTVDGDVHISPSGSTGTTYLTIVHSSTALLLGGGGSTSSINIQATGTQIVAIQALGTNSNVYYDATTHHWRTNVGSDVMLLTGSGFVTSLVFALDAAVTITQAVATPLADAPQFTIAAATGGAGGGAGGDLVLTSGTGQGGGADGLLLFELGSTGLAMSVSASEIDLFNGMGTIIFQNSVVSDILIQHASIASAAGHNFKIEAQTSGSGGHNGGYMLLGGGADSSANLTGGVRLYIDADPTNGILLEIGDVIAGKRVLTVLRGTVLTSTQMPANTGDRVMYFADCATAPTAAPVSGVIPFSEGGVWKYMDTSGTVVTL